MSAPRYLPALVPAWSWYLPGPGTCLALTALAAALTGTPEMAGTLGNGPERQ